MLGMMVACQHELTGAKDVDNPVVESREVVELHITAPIDAAGDTTGVRRIVYRDNGAGGLHPTWSFADSMAVYIERTDHSIIYAGKVVSEGTQVVDGVRKFGGKALQKAINEKYLYVYPYVEDGTAIGAATTRSIAWTSQSGALGRTDHISNLLPLVWREDVKHDNVLTPPERQGYVIRLRMLFHDYPGTISNVRIQTMARGNDGTTPDRIFPCRFSMANLGKEVNSTLDAKTEGTELSDTDYADALTLNVTGGEAIKNNDGLYEAEAYLVCGNVQNLNVFSTKYHVVVKTVGGTSYSMSDYRSLRGQQTANRTNGLPMLGNDTVFTLTAKYSKGVCNTVINDQYGVHSLLGMWNDYGKGYDPIGLVVYAGGDAVLTPGTVPSQLADNKTDILTKYKNNGTGTPTLFGATTYGSPAQNSIYAATAAAIADTKQRDVTINNIEITRPTEVFVTFINEYGWNENLLGYYHYTGAAPEDAEVMSMRKTLIFPNFSKPFHEPFNKQPEGTGLDKNNIGQPSDAPLREYETVKLLYTDEHGFVSTIFPAGTTIGFMMMIDTKANEESPKRGFDLLNWGQWRLFTNTIWNETNTTANGANANWPAGGYYRNNFFASADVCRDAEPVPGLAIYGVKDQGNNDLNTAYGAMIYMVSTGDPGAMLTHNSVYFNIGTGALVINK